jgi:hypothetical protein
LYPPAQLQDRGFRAKPDKPFSYLGLLIVRFLLTQTKLCALRKGAERLEMAAQARQKGML